MYKANHVQQHSKFDNKLQMMLMSTNLYRTFDQQIEAFLQMH
jgi:hypothetical protein